MRGTWWYLYLIVDVFSRKIVGHEVYESETGELACELIEKARWREHLAAQRQPLILHSDNGSPMKAATFLEKLYDLGITPSRSRPRVSNDNAYSEALFRTLKYRPSLLVERASPRLDRPDNGCTARALVQPRTPSQRTAVCDTGSTPQRRGEANPRPVTGHLRARPAGPPNAGAAASGTSGCLSAST